MLGLALRDIPDEVVEEPVLLDSPEMGGRAMLNPKWIKLAYKS